MKDVHVLVPEELDELINTRAKNSGLSKSELIRRILKSWKREQEIQDQWSAQEWASFLGDEFDSYEEALIATVLEPESDASTETKAGDASRATICCL